jgi:hypothetical protein
MKGHLSDRGQEMSWVWKQGNRRFRKFFAVSSLSLAAIVAPLAILSTTPASASTPTPQLIVPADPTSTVAGVAIDPVTGAIFTVNPLAETVAVLPKVSGTLFGQQVTANVQTVLEAATGLDQPASLVFDGSGNLYISNAGYADSITVLARTTGTIFGQAVTANVAVTLAAAQGIITPEGMAFDQAGNLYVVSNSLHDVAVITQSTATIFGQNAPANTTTFLPETAGASGATDVVFGTDGTMFISGDQHIYALLQSGGNVFGQDVQTATLTSLNAVTSTGPGINGMYVDGAGNLFYANQTSSSPEVDVLSSGFTQIFGTMPVLNSQTPLVNITAPYPVGVVGDSAGNLFISNGVNTNAQESGLGVIAPQQEVLFGQSLTANTYLGFPSTELLDIPAGLVVGPDGNVFVINDVSSNIVVYPSQSGTLFGQSVTKGIPAVLAAATGLTEPSTIALDNSGDLVVWSYQIGVMTIVPRVTGTIFGQSVTANVATTLNAASGLTSIVSMQFDHQGDLFVVDGSTETVQVIPSADKTLFGQSVTANTVVSLTATSTIASPTILAFDPSGNLFVPDTDGKLWMVAQQSGTLFGQAVNANIPAQFAGFTFFPSQGFGGATALSFDSLGNLYLPADTTADSYTGEIYVIAKQAGSFFGQQIPANTPTVLSSVQGLHTLLGLGLNLQGDLYILNLQGLWKLTNPNPVTPVTPATLLAATGTPFAPLGLLGVSLLGFGFALCVKAKRRREI